MSASLRLIETGVYKDKIGWTKKQIVVGLLSTVLMIAFVAAGVIYNHFQWYPNEPQYLLSEAVTVDAIVSHLEELEKIAIQNNNSRSVATGYRDSAQYVKKHLDDNCGCEVTLEDFNAGLFYENSPPTLEMESPLYVQFQNTIDFIGLRYSGNNTWNFTAPIVMIPNFGCNISDFGDLNGSIAVIAAQNTGDCSVFNKTLYAQQSNASAVIVYYPSGVRPRNVTLYAVSGRGYLEGDPFIGIPAFTATYTFGILMERNPNAILRVSFDTSLILFPTMNVICATKEGNPKNKIYVGAHLDSVPAGPGMDDNGSGSSTILEIVTQWYALGLVPENQIVFAWWSAEEIGLVGSSHHVEQLAKQGTIGDVAACLNYDMVASPNFIISIANGTSSPYSPVGSQQITNVFVEYMDTWEIPYQYFQTSFGRSDFVPFENKGIPIGSLFTGADGVKTEEEFHKFGGIVNAIHDPCYHQLCDNTININREALGYMCGASAYMVQHLAQQPNIRQYLNNSTTQNK